MYPLSQAFDAIKQEFETARTQSAQAARSQIANELNQFVRRLRQYKTQEEWAAAVVECAGRFAHSVALFALENGVVHLRGQRNLALAPDFSFRPEEAGAFKGVIESREPVVAVRTSAEVTNALSASDGRGNLVPIFNGSRLVAILFTAGDGYMDLNATELIAGLASLVLERESNASLHTQIVAAPVNHSAPPKASTRLPAWADLDEMQRSLHVRAQRFSRVKVAEMQLSRPEACEAGRRQSSIYLFLKREIENARDLYRRQFMTATSMVDYLHLELVRVLAEGDEAKLGADYPGQLV